MRWTRALPPALLLLCLLTPGAQAAAPGTLTGSVTGVTAPPAGRGEAMLRAMNLNTGALTRTVRVKRGGTFRLRAPAGTYALMGSEVRLPPNGRVIDKLVGSGRLTAGRTTKVALSTKGLRKKKKRRKRRRRPAARVTQTSGIGDVSVPYPAIWVKRFTITGGGEAWKYMGKGTSDLVLTDLVGLVGADGCKGAVVERDRIDDVLREIELQQSKFFDPKTRVKKGKLIKDNSTVTGSVAIAGEGAAQQVTITATYQNFDTGQKTTLSKTGPASQILELEEQLAAELAKAICNPPCPSKAGVRAAQTCNVPIAAPPAYSGTFSSRQTNASVPGFLLEWGGGTVRYADHTAYSGIYDGYSAVSGSATATVHTPGSEGCEVDGSGPVDFSAGPYGTGQLNIYAGDPQTYQLMLQPSSPTASIPTITSGCDDSANNGKAGSFPLYGQRVLVVPKTGQANLPVQAGGAIAGDLTYSEGPQTWTFHWALNPSE